MKKKPAKKKRAIARKPAKSTKPKKKTSTAQPRPPAKILAVRSLLTITEDTGPRSPQAATAPIPTRDYVYGCIRTAAPGRPFNDASTLNSIPVRGDDVGLCLNRSIPLTGQRAWRRGQILGSWQVSLLIGLTDAKRNS